jgi:signal peptidase I
MMERSAASPAEVVQPPVRQRAVKERAEETETPLEALASMAVVLVIGLFIFGFVFQNFMIPSASMEKTLLIGDHVVVDRITLSPPTKWAPFVHYRPVHRGDIIVFLKPNPETPDLILVKRAIGLPGDHIHLQHGVVYINGVAQNEPYAMQPTEGDGSQTTYEGGREDDSLPRPYEHARDDFPADVPGIQEQATANHAAVWAENLPSHIENGDIVVPAGKVFAMGDNRTNSLDSRYWGFVPVENIEGRPMFVYWSFQTPADQEDKTSLGDRISFFVHEFTHFLTQTRWSRTFHVTR